jgi:hypothetical protein
VRRDVEHWVADVRVAAVVFAALEVGVFTEHYPAGYERRAWALTAAFALGAVAFAVIVRRASSRWTLPVAVASVVGLYIARSIAEAHGGSLEVETGPARGAVFTLSLPVG